MRPSGAVRVATGPAGPWGAGATAVTGDTEPRTLQREREADWAGGVEGVTVHIHEEIKTQTVSYAAVVSNFILLTDCQNFKLKKTKKQKPNTKVGPEQ